MKNITKIFNIDAEMEEALEELRNPNSDAKKLYKLHLRMVAKKAAKGAVIGLPTGLAIGLVYNVIKNAVEETDSPEEEN